MGTLFTANQTFIDYLNSNGLIEFTERNPKTAKRQFWIPISTASVWFDYSTIELVKDKKILFSDSKISEEKIDQFIKENFRAVSLEGY